MLEEENYDNYFEGGKGCVFREEGTKTFLHNRMDTHMREIRIYRKDSLAAM